MPPAVFIDRDNTLIVNDGDLGDPGRVRLVEGAAEGLRRLRAAGFRLVVVSNQGGVARGAFTEADVESVHRRIAGLLADATGRDDLIDAFYYCPFHPQGTVEAYRREHPWRKPQPGMLLAAASALDLDLPSSWLIGDQPRDVAAGRAAGCSTVLISGDRRAIEEAGATAVVTTLAEGADVVLAARRGPRDRNMGE
jgi:D,D-heptose 1,7-bisphosphate phosphatase